jgi:hypothetical protein
MPPTPNAQLPRTVPLAAAAVVDTAAGLGLVAMVEVIQAAATATAARAAAGAVADIKAAEIPKAMGALAEVTLAMVTPAVMIPEMVISRKLMMLVVMVESGVMSPQLRPVPRPALTRRSGIATLRNFLRRLEAGMARLSRRITFPRSPAI